MSFRIVAGPELIKNLKTAMSSDAEICLAVAFWGAGAADRLGLTQGREARVVCNLSMGGTNPSEIRNLLKRGVKVLQHATLHAKIGIVGKGLSFVGSSNMSANGLGIEAAELTGWEEANVLFDHVDQELRLRFDVLWNQAQAITNEDLKAAEKRWRARRTLCLQDQKMSASDRISLWTAITTNSDRLRSSPCSIAYYYEMDDDDKAEFDVAEAEIKVEFGKGRTAFMDWSDLPEGYIIGACRSRSYDHRIKDVEISRRPPNAPTYTNGSTPFQVVEQMKELPGFTAIKGSDLANFKALLLSYLKGRKPKKSRVIPIWKLMDFHAETMIQ